MYVLSMFRGRTNNWKKNPITKENLKIYQWIDYMKKMIYVMYIISFIYIQIMVWGDWILMGDRYTIWIGQTH